jgi:Fic family protein
MSLMERKTQGRYTTISTVGEKAQAFIPAPLPPDPPIVWTAELHDKFDDALVWLGRLDSVCALLPDAPLFLYSYVRREAVLSSQIEGTQSSLSDLLLFEIDEKPGVPLNDVQEVSNYVAAMNHGLTRLSEGFPLCLRLFREIHGVLMSRGRGSRQSPGEFRTSQNWIGGTRPGNAAFVPPPPQDVPECMTKLERFLHDDPVSTPILVKAALAHLQFETIHPFLDGNGRVGRLLITLLLCDQKILRQPMLYLSLYFKTHRQYYYELLNRVRLNGDWEAWLNFFAEAIIETAKQAVHTAEELGTLTQNDQAKIRGLGRAAHSALNVQRALMENPIANVTTLVKKTRLTATSVNKALAHMVNLGIVNELTAKQRNRLFSYDRYIEILNRSDT